MNPRQKKKFDAIVADFDKFYRTTCKKDGIPDNSVARTAFYEACLGIVRDGPRLRSAEVQSELVRYYTKLRNEEYRKVILELD
jgi:hypothetical protein